MSTFTALNIEPDDQIDDEVDNTKELQIEEGLKLYQVALKYHSQGPAGFSQAADAYTTLFNSEIFKYPESITEFDRICQNPELELVDPSFVLDLDLAGAGADGAPSTLPQILYLSYKNHGQFILDCVKSQIPRPGPSGSEPFDISSVDHQARAALNYFTLALASDPSDTELWRRAARVAATLGSRRVARYCLEAAVEVDDDPTVAEIDPASLEEGFAGEQLKEQLQVLGDDTALSHPVMAPFLKKTMPSYLTKYMDPYAFLPDPTKSLGGNIPGVLDDTEREGMEVDNRFVINCPQRGWTAIGDAICTAFLSSHGLSGTGILLTVPDEHDAESEPTAAEDQIMKDPETIKSPSAESSEATVATHVTGKPDDPPVTTITTTTIVPLSDESRRQSSVALPTRKRSQSAAGICETPEEDNGTQKRSKRIRNRDNTEGSVDPATQYAEQLKPYVQADGDVFSFLGRLLNKLEVYDLEPFSELQAALSNDDKSDHNEALANTAIRDLRDILKAWDDDKASTFLNANAADILGSSAASANAGLAAFLEHSKSGPLKFSSIPPFSESEGVSSFVATIRDQWTSLQDVIYDWLLAVLRTYRGTLWSEDLKVAIVRIITFADADIFNRFQEEMERARSGSGHESDSAQLDELAQTFFELHLDIYSRITNPNSIVQYETRVITKERLDRWADLAASVLRTGKYDANDEISLRYIWASVFYATMADNVSREHKVLCWSDLRTLLQDAGTQPIELQNDDVMPEISVDAAEREVSRLTTMDFFFNLFQTDTSDPVAIIETLEPVLDPESACQRPQPDGDTGAGVETMDTTPAALRDMWKFLKAGSTSLRLFLWQRLRDAYSSIGYNTKVFSCHLKSIEIIVGDLRTDDYVDSADEPRRHRLLTWLKALDDLLVKSLTIALNDAATCFEIIDDRHIKTTCAALAQLTTVLHTAAIFDDEVRVGITQLPQNPAYSPHGSFTGFANKLREMQVRTWSLQYCMVKEAMAQNAELFPDRSNDLAEFLALVHNCLGLRKFCKASNKIFLKMMKMEMLRLKEVDRWEDYLGQVLYDLYAIRLGVGTYPLEDHGCPTEPLDRRTVLSIADHVIALAIQMPMKDLLKHELRSTIEKMQAAVGQAKSSPQMLHNLRNYSDYLKGSIRPLDMYKALKGQLQVDSLPVITPESSLADKGWYFLHGIIALTKFRSQRRLGPGAQQDDLRVSASFIRLQLQFTPDDWETWYRLAQCFDYELEEEVMWSADKINNHRAELVKLQRSAIHCYVMALSTAVRTADDSPATAEKLSEMYYDFGMRLYASSREPFGMEAFWVDEFEKHMSGSTGMYKKPLHDEMSRYRVWKYAATLFRKSLADRPNHWMNYYMLGKCLWKMFCKAADEWDPQVQATKPSMESVLSALIKTIETVPKPRDGRQEPILEPHYKLASVVHKLVLLGAMQPQAAADLLQRQPYAVDKGEHIEVHDQEVWESFILKTMRHLRSADKQHWHHRMIARVANILYDEEHPDYVQASAARHEFRESIFTKTMHIQVWKPDAERPGRHCVYMERYVRYICKILLVLNDKTNMEQLAKRVRKKAPDFHRFSVVWSEVCTTYLRLIRRAANIPANMDEVFKSVPHEEFEEFSDRLNGWVTDPTILHPTLDALRETIELKKLNANQMKPAPIDDLINDAWAVLYTQVAKTLPGPDPALRPHADGEMATGPRPMGRMSLNNLVMDMSGTQIPVPVTFAGSEPSRPRKVGISRREVLRRAELAVGRMSDVSRTPAPSRPMLSEPTMILGSNGDLEQISAPGPRTKGATAQETEEKSDDSSAPGSVHDSADDESDLSDVPDMDDADPSMIFPNLMKSDEPMNSSGGEGTGTPAPE
ncbi:TPR-like protein [Venustampulla echinocandica]|uniref:Histone transcription regulator 3 homolog n=1 Tax=Venustampulla echinocandica TaxID=2656787 RepID=A0A370U3H6_9HELO|nr:TPR-like protein [Venustampulla echinocandica]RDL42315.1 TPR-like protein [Venustampulla echinocandica]